MIKAVVLDIDGVIVGNKRGFNFPHPSKKVISALQKIHSKGIPVSFITGKPTFTAIRNIQAVGIDNPHIADGGGTIFNPVSNKIISVVQVKHKAVKTLFELLGENIYINPFTIEKYYLNKKLKNNFTDLYSKFLGHSPILVDSLEKALISECVTKINIFAFNARDKEVITAVLNKLSDQLDFIWTINSHITPIEVIVVTPKGVSKRTGVKKLVGFLGISTDDTLGVGDTLHDWDFIEICGYKAAMGNAMEDLKEKIDKSDARQFIGGHIDDDGLLDVFRYFKLI